MKRFSALLLLLCLLSGCSPHTPAASSPDQPAPTEEPCIPGLYNPDSAVEAYTGGAIRCYPLGNLPGSIIAPFSGGLILLSHTESTTNVSRLEGLEAIPTASLTLPFIVDRLHHWHEDGFSFFDTACGEILAVDNQLQIIRRIPVPAGIFGSPTLSPDGETLYYCTSDSIRAMDLATGISRVLRECTYPGQSVSGLLLEDSVLHCTIQEGNSIFLRTDTGATVSTKEGVREIVTSGRSYYAQILEDGYPLRVFGLEGEQPKLLLLPESESLCYFLPSYNAAITVQESDDAISLLQYTLDSGQRTAALSVRGISSPRCFTAGPEGGIWFLGFDESYGCDSLYRWDPSASPVSDPTVYTHQYITRETPDEAGLAQCADMARELGEAYGIEILIHPPADTALVDGYRFTEEHLTPVLRSTLETLATNLSHYPDGFLNTLAQRFDGLTICILRAVESNSSQETAGNSEDILLWDGHHAYIALTGGTGAEQALYHGLCHLIDTMVLTECSAYDTWDQLNPTGFRYDYDYAVNRQRNSTAYLLDHSRYFVDMYSMSFPNEDRARIMEYAIRPVS